MATRNSFKNPEFYDLTRGVTTVYVMTAWNEAVKVGKLDIRDRLKNAVEVSYREQSHSITITRILY